MVPIQPANLTTPELLNAIAGELDGLSQKMEDEKFVFLAQQGRLLAHDCRSLAYLFAAGVNDPPPL